MAQHLHVAEDAIHGCSHGGDDAVLKADSIMGRIGTAFEIQIPPVLTDLLTWGAQVLRLPSVDTADDVDTISEPDSSIGDTNLPPTTKTCTVCDGTLPTTSFASPAAGTACMHEHDTCKACWQEWLEAQLSNVEVQATNIKCAQCSNTLHQNDVQAHASPALFARYHRACICLLISVDMDFRWCINGACTSGQIHDAGSEGNIFTCEACGHKSCVDCNANLHTGQTCAQFREQRAKERAEERAAFQQWEYLKEVEAKRRRGSISDKAASTLVLRDAGEPSATSERLAFEDAESSVTVAEHSKQCPGCSSRVQKREYVTTESTHSQITANIYTVAAIT